MVLVCLAVGTAEGQSRGRWRLPSTPAQFFGCGHGPGHHAPMVRMPCYTPMSVQRLEFARPPVGQGYYESGCADWSCYGSNEIVQPMPSSPSSPSQDMFSAPAMPITPMAPQPDLSETPDESEANELLPTPEN